MSFIPERIRDYFPEVELSRRFASAAFCLLSLYNVNPVLSADNGLFDDRCPSDRDLAHTAVGPPAAEPEGRDIIEVASYNIAHGKLGIDGIIESIRIAEPDVIALQEVTSDNIAEIVEAFDLDPEVSVATGYTMEAHGGDFGNAVIVFSGEIKTSRVLDLPVTGDLEPRNLVLASVKSGDIDYTFLSTHLTPDWDNTDYSWLRQKQAMSLLEVIGELPNDRVVMGLDANDDKDSLALKTLFMGLELPYIELLKKYPANYVTYPGMNRFNGKVIDFTLFGTGFRSVGRRIGGQCRSDHQLISENLKAWSYKSKLVVE